jgi:SAM-dependent methyltransferase
MQATGYLHPQVMAGLACRHIRDLNSSILDAGCGTGVIGRALEVLGYRNLVGLDLSPGMLEQARQLGAYRQLHCAALGSPLDFADGELDAVVSTGVFTAGHAPAVAFDELVRIMKPGGVLISTFGTVVWERDGFAAKFAELTKRGLVSEVEVTRAYRPMPNSAAEAHVTTRAHVFRRL